MRPGVIDIRSDPELCSHARAKAAALETLVQRGIVGSAWAATNRSCSHVLDSPWLFVTSGHVHEWFDRSRDPSDHAGGADRVHRRQASDAAWTPALTIAARIAREHRGSDGAVLWIGRACWPYPSALAHRRDGERCALVARSVFVDAATHEERVWAIDVALRSRAVSVVVADARGLTMAESRRLQLGAAAGGATGLLMRSGDELRELSAAQTRWVVTPERDPMIARDAIVKPRWSIELRRCKGSHAARLNAGRFVVELDHETSDVRVVSEALNRSAASTGPPAGAELRRA